MSHSAATEEVPQPMSNDSDGSRKGGDGTTEAKVVGNNNLDDREGDPRKENLPLYSRVPRFGTLLNGASFRVSLGSSSYASVMYSGRRLGPDAIPGSDGRCGPDDGPQCDDCKALMYRGGGRLEVLRRTVPALTGLVSFLMADEDAAKGEGDGEREVAWEAQRTQNKKGKNKVQQNKKQKGQKNNKDNDRDKEDRATTQMLVLALRRSGGVLPAAAKYLCNRLPGIKVLSSPGLALPPLPTDIASYSSSSLSPPPPDHDGQADGSVTAVRNLCGTLGIEAETAEAALRRNGNDIQRAAAFLLDDPEAVSTAVQEFILERERGNAKWVERHERHERTLEEACSGTTIIESMTTADGMDEENNERIRAHLKKTVMNMIKGAVTFQKVSIEAEETERGRNKDDRVEEDGEGRTLTEKYNIEENKLSAVICSHGAPSRRVIRSGGDKHDEKDKDKKDEGRNVIVGDRFAVSGHLLVRVGPVLGPDSDGSAAFGVNKHCILCSGAVPSPECGDYVCQLCNICEGCIQSPTKDGQEDADINDEEDEEESPISSGTAKSPNELPRIGFAQSCPALRNGSHLHVHPLTYNLERHRTTCRCNVGKSGCAEVVWSCVQCNFDVCTACVARPPPSGYDRLSSTMTKGRENGGDESREEEEEEEDLDEYGRGSLTSPGTGWIGYLPFSHVDAERRAAARWEGANFSDPPIGEAVVGTGEASHGDAFVVTCPIRLGGGHGDRREARRKLRSAETCRVGEVRLAEDAEDALELLREGEWQKKGTIVCGRGKKRKAVAPPQSSDLEVDELSVRVNFPSASVVPAADLAHAEELLHRSQSMNGDALMNRELCRAVASGRLDLAGSLLLSDAYAPVICEDAASDISAADALARVGRNDNDDNGGHTDAAIETRSGNTEETNGQEECWCGFPIDCSSSPDGSVGCLGGHAMHPSCASDLLLSGGSCPTCRMRLYFPCVPEAEGRIATELVEADLRRSEKHKFAADDKGGDPAQIFAVDDFVSIDPDPKKCCDEQMGEPRSGGWFDDMGSSCGKVGRITELICDEEPGAEGDARGLRIIAARVRTRAEEHNLERIWRRFNYQCKNCYMYGPSRETGRRKCSHCRLCERCCLRSRENRLCSQSHNEWTWSPSLLRKAIPLWKDSSLLDPEEAAARNAECHVMRLRAELKTVAAAREGLRAKTSGLKMPLMINTSGVSKGTPKLQLHKDAIDALCHLWGKVSFSDWTWARHLLTLAHQWDDNIAKDNPHDVAYDTNDFAASRRSLAEMCGAVREGDLDSVARAVRRRNTSRMAERLRWEDAVCATGEYVVSPTARVELRAFPADFAPRTGFSLHPESSFRSRREMLDSKGNLWLQVDPKSFPSHDGGENNGKVVADLSNQMTSKALVGARVRRGPDWKWNDQDGGEGNAGVIVQVVQCGKVSVRWDAGSSARQYEYRAGNGHHDLLFVNAAPQAPQGWLSVRPAGHGSPAVVWRSRSALRCFCCGDGLVPPRSDRGRYASARGAAIKEGDKLFVAATLEADVVKFVAGGRVRCAFAFEDGPVPDWAAETGPDERFDVWYRLEDLVLPKERGQVWRDDEVVRIKGQLRTRREVVLMCDGDEVSARRMWDEAKKRSKSGKNHVEEDGLSFASCIRGHFLHARCLQGALLAGRECPAIGCKEPLCVPRVKRICGDDTCCGADGTDVAAAATEIEEEADLLRTAEGLIQRSRASETSSSAAGDDARMSDAGLPDLKMCPACCFGPLINQNCSNMEAHHGQCSRVAIRGSANDEVPCTSHGMFSASAVEIAELIKHMSSSQVVTDVLPKCPTHKVPVMFNGCLCCGHLFTDTDWNKMPKWDSKAKSLLELDNKKRKAADLLAKQVRTEVAHFQFERDQFDRFEAMCKLCSDDNSSDDAATLPPLPPPASKYVLRGCGPSCNTRHSRDGECLVCGRTWGAHSGHTCPVGRMRGSWVRR